VLTADRRNEIQTKARAAIKAATLRRDPWWALPGFYAVFLTVLIAYSTWAAVVRTGYYHDPYISPIFSPCLAANCLKGSVRLLGAWWIISPAIAVVWLPISFRITCYYYRKAYYRAFAFLPNFGPPACAVREPHKRYFGETRFPFIIQNLHRYFWYLMIGNMVFLYWDTVRAFHFPDGWGVGVGSLIFVVMITTMTLYMLSCHTCRHVVGGHVNVFSRAPLRYRGWKIVNVLNERHGTYALMSLFFIPVTDLYVRLVATGVIHDIRLIR
jgi:hypothetical protein